MLETLNNRQLNPYISLGSSPNASRAAEQRIDGAYASYQNASYGWIYCYQPVVRETFEYVARNIAQLGLKVYKRVSDDEREHAGDHPAAEALRWPNPWTPGQHFIYDVVTDWLIYDNAYALKFPSDDGLTLVSIPPPLVGIRGRSLYQPEGYTIRDQNDNAIRVPAERMFHWRGKNPSDPRKGESKLETLREELASDAANRQAGTELAKSGLRLPGWVERPIEAPDWTDEALKRFKESAAAAAKKSTRELPVFEEGMSYKTGGITPEDAELLAARRWTAEQVAGQIGMKNIPPESEEERRQFYADVLEPLTEMLAAFLDLHVLVREYGATDHYFEFNLDEKRMSDDRIKTLVSAAGAPIMLRDEVRAHLNLPALPDGQGQEIVTPLNVTEGGKPSPQVMPPQNPNGPPQDGSYRSGEADRPVPAGGKALEVEMNGNGHKTAPLVPRRKRASDRRDSWAKQYEDALLHHFNRQENVTKSKQVKSVTDDRWDRELAEDLGGIYLRHFTAEGKHAAFRMASEFDPEHGHNWLAAKAIGSAKSINQTTQDVIDQKGVADAFSEAKAFRASGAAMAMATDVAAFATKVAMEQAPGEPMVTIDGGECDVCAPFQGTWAVRDLEQWPGYHANCTCVADPISAPAKALDTKTTAQPQNINITLQVADGAVKFLPPSVTMESPPPAQVDVNPTFHAHVDAPQVHVEPSQLTIEEGAVTAPNVTVQAPEPSPAPEVNVHNPITVESPEVKIAEGAFQVDVQPAQAPKAPDVNVNVEPQQTKTTRQVIRDENGHIKAIVDENRKQIVKRDSSGRIESIEEE